MAIANHVLRVKEQIRRGDFTSEAAVSQGIILPTLHELGWPVFNTCIVVPEYSLEGRRVDYALCHPENRPSVFIEVKKVGQSDGADRQLFEYAFHLGVPMAILTDGEEWSIYLPGEKGRYDERRVYKINLLEHDIEELTYRFERYLNYDKVCAGEALKAARLDYKDISRDRDISQALPKAWSLLLDAADPLLLELLSEKTEDLCGFKPDLDVCSKFLHVSAKNPGISAAGKSEYSPSGKTKQDFRKVPNHKPKSSKTDKVSFLFDNKKYTAKSARDAMILFFQLLSKHDDSFLERFTARKHGRKRRYISQDKYELYPERSDLAENHSIEFVPGWWLGLNFSRNNIQQIVNLALEVAQPRLRSRIQIQLD